jgi:hypothetical protein
MSKRDLLFCFNMSKRDLQVKAKKTRVLMSGKEEDTCMSYERDLQVKAKKTRVLMSVKEEDTYRVLIRLSYRSS